MIFKVIVEKDIKQRFKMIVDLKSLGKDFDKKGFYVRIWMWISLVIP